MKVCPENVCIHPAGGLEAHAELNIINNLPKPPTPGDKLLLSIDWNSDKGKGNPNPCPNCAKTITCACQCLQISTCDKDGQRIDRCKDPSKVDM